MTKEKLKEDIDDWFTYHKPTEDQLPKFQAIRDAAKVFANVLVDNTPVCEDQIRCIQNLRLLVMSANQAIACNGR